MMTHPSHKTELKKLNRISGQIEGIKKMIEDHRYCPDILTQLRAVRAAVRSVEANVLQGHLDHCISDVLGDNDANTAREKIQELKNLFKRFEE